MLLSHLSLTNFRNFIRLEQDLPQGSTILVGSNAQGKTSLLEAIHYLAGATSLHSTNDRQLINFLSLQEAVPYCRIVAEFRRLDRVNRIEIRLRLDPTGVLGEHRLRKEILINGLKKKVGDLAGFFNVVMFLPQDMRVIEGPPDTRRRYLDFSLSQADPIYAQSRLEYSKVLTQRNALLKQLQERNSTNDEMTFWDERITDLGSTIMLARASALLEMEQIVAKIHNELTRNGEHLRLIYKPSYDPEAKPQGQLGLPMESSMDWKKISREKLRSGYLEALQRSRRDEIRRGMTSLGPHRDDFRFLANSIDLHLYGSRGQNRTAMLAAKLAEVEWLKKRTGEWPVLLLDEVLAELDPVRRRDLLTRLESVSQALITSADLQMIDGEFRDKSTVWEISAGTIRSLSPEKLD